MQTYVVDVQRDNEQHAVATTRYFSLTVGARRGDATAGFNPVETLLSALGACLLTTLQMVAELWRIPVTGMAIHLTGVRQDQPPQLLSVTYVLNVQTDVAVDRLTRLVETAQCNGTVYQTLALAIPVSGTVVRDDGTAPI
jgi:uncharacterized OsmC-like protein